MDSSPTPCAARIAPHPYRRRHRALRTVPGILTIEGAWITGFEPLDDNTVFSQDTLDMGDKWITPSFVNAHTHIALGVMRGMDVESASAGNMVEEVGSL